MEKKANAGVVIGDSDEFETALKQQTVSLFQSTIDHQSLPGAMLIHKGYVISMPNMGLIFS